MKQSLFLLILFVLISCRNSNTADKWSAFEYPEINFVNQAPDTEGWEIYNRIIPNPEEYIKAAITEVVQTLYWSDQDSIPGVTKINYRFRDYNGISAKSGAPPEIRIDYSSRHVERSARDGGDDKVLFETRGVLLHELVHGFQLEPQGIGNYGNSKEFHVFIEGMADAVRIVNGGFPEGNRRSGGRWDDSYQRTGYFLDWITTTKDPDFLRKFNKSTLEIIPWGFDKAIKHILGNQYNVDDLWEEYQAAIR
jgi:hypothetical protein